MLYLKDKEDTFLYYSQKTNWYFVDCEFIKKHSMCQCHTYNSKITELNISHFTYTQPATINLTEIKCGLYKVAVLVLRGHPTGPTALDTGLKLKLRD